MTPALYRLRLPHGTPRLARGTVEEGPLELLGAGVSLDALLTVGAAELERAATRRTGELVPAGATFVAPLESQEVWGAGVTYERSRDARIEESATASTVYDGVYDALRPELFFKAPGWRVRGPSETIGVRADSEWNVPEPELAVVLDRHGAIAAYAIGNDVSSRSIEGENPLYLPQAKMYEHSCSIGAALVPAAHASEPFAIRMTIERGGAQAFVGEASTAQMHRTITELAAHLYSALTFPVGAALLTGTMLVPDPPFTLTEGDVVRLAISGLGELVNPVERVGRAIGSGVHRDPP